MSSPTVAVNPAEVGSTASQVLGTASDVETVHTQLFNFKGNSSDAGTAYAAAGSAYHSGVTATLDPLLTGYHDAINFLGEALQDAASGYDEVDQSSSWQLQQAAGASSGSAPGATGPSSNGTGQPPGGAGSSTPSTTSPPPGGSSSGSSVTGGRSTGGGSTGGGTTSGPTGPAGGDPGIYTSPSSGSPSGTVEV